MKSKPNEQTSLVSVKSLKPMRSLTTSSSFYETNPFCDSAFSDSYLSSDHSSRLNLTADKFQLVVF